MYNETQKRIIMLIKNIQQKYRPPTVRAWIFTYIWRGKVCVIAMISIRMVGDNWLRKRKKIEARLKTLKDANVTVMISGEYIKYVIEA